MTSINSDIIIRIREAWIEVPYPGDDKIFIPNSYDDEGITDYFQGTTWEHHRVEDLRAHSSAISTFFTAEAYHYWIAAFLIAAVLDPEELSQGVDAIVSSLSPGALGSKRERALVQKLNLFTRTQLLVLTNVVEAITEWQEMPDHPEWTREEKEVLVYLYQRLNNV